MPISVKCACGAVINAPDSAAGKKGTCLKCGKLVIVPNLNSSGKLGFIDEDEEEQVSTSKEKRCLKCGADYSFDAVVCVKCGINLDTGKEIDGVFKQKESNLKKLLIIGAMVGGIIVTIIVFSLIKSKPKSSAWKGKGWVAVGAKTKSFCPASQGQIMGSTSAVYLWVDVRLKREFRDWELKSFRMKKRNGYLVGELQKILSNKKDKNKITVIFENSPRGWGPLENYILLGPE